MAPTGRPVRQKARDLVLQQRRAEVLPHARRVAAGEDRGRRSRRARSRSRRSAAGTPAPRPSRRRRRAPRSAGPSEPSDAVEQLPSADGAAPPPLSVAKTTSCPSRVSVRHGTAVSVGSKSAIRQRHQDARHAPIVMGLARVVKPRNAHDLRIDALAPDASTCTGSCRPTRSSRACRARRRSTAGGATRWSAWSPSTSRGRRRARSCRRRWRTCSAIASSTCAPTSRGPRGRA